MLKPMRVGVVFGTTDRLEFVKNETNQHKQKS